MYRLLLAIGLGGCAAFSPDPGDPLLADARPAEGPDLAADEPDLAAPAEDLAAPADLPVSLPDLAGPPDLIEVRDLGGGAAHPRVNEIAPAAGGVNTDEFVELIGGAADLDLTDHTLRYQSAGGGESVLLTFRGVTLPKGGHLLAAAAGSRFATMADVHFNAGGTGRLGKGGGAVGLFDPAGARLDSLAWGDAGGSYVEGAPAPAPGDAGCSRFPDGADTDRNDRDAHTAEPTPRMPNK